ncbi:MAG TPA: 6-hydroxymethylpterin diphosphokinase MptE-like protein [Candidatus Thermoplasmatota archaeon]|nr:6-hydroxymethylpterin diphosphokinase MptE-like protein [Candidatus Thermoplasmatota archaeon]
MDWAAWEPHYRALCAQFGYREEDDLAAAWELHALVPARCRFRDLGVLLRNRREVAVVGAGPSLERTRPAALAGRALVACDGAATWLRESGLVPHAVVTDLDGAPGDLAWAAAQGSSMVVHAHGDNRAALRELAPRLGPQLYGTYQCGPRPGLEPMRNVGGFTDGDRAVLLCEALGARSALLFGFDFAAPPSRYSHRWDPATKPAKLAWAQRLVGEAAARGRMAVALHAP